jgi:hypothetical protein
VASLFKDLAVAQYHDVVGVADHPLVVYASREGEGERRRRVEVRRAAEWTGDRDPDWQGDAAPYTAPELREAFLLLGDRLPRAFGHHAQVAGGPAYTGAKLLERALPRGKSYPVLDEDVRELLHHTATQHRFEVCPDAALAELPGFAYLDGRTMYGALLRELPVGPARHVQGGGSFAGERAWYQRAWCRARVTVPAGWAHIGVLAGKAGAAGWEYPRQPRRTFETWASTYELKLAREHGWTVEVAEALVFDTGEPLRTWGAKRVGGDREPGLFGLLPLAGRTGAADPRVAELAQGMVRALLLQTIGSFHRRAREVTYRARVGEAARLPPDLYDVQRLPGGVIVGKAIEPLGPEAQRLQHPEWSSWIWSRERVRILQAPDGTGALTLPRAQVVGMRGDALYLTRDPGWPDDDRLGRLRLKGYAPGPHPVPQTPIELDQLRALAAALGPEGKHGGGRQ